MSTKHKLIHITWTENLVDGRQVEELEKMTTMSFLRDGVPGPDDFLAEVEALSCEVAVVDQQLHCPELQRGDYEDFSTQEDKIKVCQNQTGFGWVGLGWVGLDCVKLGWTGLGWNGLDWTGLGWVGLGWV